MTAPGPRKGGHPGRMDDRWTPISATLWNMSSAVELVVTDLDGTLSDAGERVHPRTIRAVLALGDAGIPVLVATGRRPRTAALVLEAAGLRGPAVMLDGSIGRDLRDGRAFHRVAFSPEAAPSSSGGSPARSPPAASAAPASPPTCSTGARRCRCGRWA